MRIVRDINALRNLFAATTEQTFQSELGVVNPRFTDYLVDLLIRFVRYDAIHKVRNSTGQRLYEVADMLAEAEERTDLPRREVYRHIGDYSLFWAGLYPETLKRKQQPSHRDHLIDYFQQGKRSYYLASTYDEEPYQEEAMVLRWLSDEFELCTYGLQRVRQEWDQLLQETDHPEHN
ncbi:hypothetical protein Pla110_45050 [Polystyrenella longa]|uniref:Uncharacterized protein n=1 Tax=Polystyrenella longa TaxID=2528007 RepID=A0A518CU36_9PLAN|nr:hypothetical protein [Polystyrenella longa]QDU82743.1 hypothetical protein Pla110_45050 [Polystyrenella longa]